MIFDFFDILADIVGSILLFLKPIITPIGEWMVGWISATTQFLKDNLSTGLTFYIIICAILVISGIIVNIIWPGDKPGTTYQKGVEKIDDFGTKLEKTAGEDITKEIRRCKDCGNPLGDQEVCPLCGARQI
ncbi:MAG: hypothetical protein ACW986_05720 [Promethearchaeota archaeon]